MSSKSVEQLYDEDFFAWTQVQARELRRFARLRPNVDLDLRHIAEEIADLGNERRDALRSWTRRIIEHLLLLQYPPAKEPRSGWADEVDAFRDEIEERLTATLRRDLERELPRLYARRGSGPEAGSNAMAKPTRPRDCPSAAPIRWTGFWVAGCRPSIRIGPDGHLARPPIAPRAIHADDTSVRLGISAS